MREVTPEVRVSMPQIRRLTGRPQLRQSSSELTASAREEEEETAAVWRGTDIKKQNGTEVENVYL